jgi:hypothetical protein
MLDSYHSPVAEHSLNDFWICALVSASQDAVASSNTTILDPEIRALAKQKSCFWPCEKPMEEANASRPFLEAT